MAAGGKIQSANMVQMKLSTNKLGCLIALATPVMLILVAYIIEWRVSWKYDFLNHAAVLAACREMIDHRQTYTNDPSYDEISWERNSVYLTRDKAAYGIAVPQIIRNMNPRAIIIRENYLDIRDPCIFPPRRRGAVAFPAGTKNQFGTKPYIDGFWYWDGSFQTEEMREQFYHGYYHGR